MRPVAIISGLLICATLAVATWETEIVRYQGPPKRLEGAVTDYSGAPIPWVEVEVYDHPEVWDAASLTSTEMRTKQKQKKIASGTTNENGHFKIRHVPKGYYEVRFTRMGWSILSALLNVDSHGEKLCTELRISGGSGENRVKPCR